jgi:hypothetical protein
MFATNFEINQDFMLDTLSFSENMQQAGMEKNIADMLALNLKNLQINQLENLLTKNEFRIFEKEMRHFQVSMYEFRQEIKEDFLLFKQETKSENSQFRQEIKAENDQFKQEIKAEIAEFKQEIKAEIAEFKQEIRAEIVEFKQEIRAEIVEFKQEIRAEIAEFKQEIKAEIIELKADIAEFKQEINNKIEILVTKIEFNSELDKLTLKLTIRLGTIMLTGIGIASATCSIIALLIKF